MNLWFALAGAVVVLGIVYLYARSQRKLGRSQANTDGLKKATNNAIERNKIDEDVADLSEPDLFDELYRDDNK